MEVFGNPIDRKRSPLEVMATAPSMMAQWLAARKQNREMKSVLEKYCESRGLDPTKTTVGEILGKK